MKEFLKLYLQLNRVVSVDEKVHKNYCCCSFVATVLLTFFVLCTGWKRRKVSNWTLVGWLLYLRCLWFSNLWDRATHPYVLFLISSWHLRTLQPGTLVLFPVYISSLSLLKVNNLIQTQTSCTTHANIPLLSWRQQPPTYLSRDVFIFFCSFAILSSLSLYIYISPLW